MSDGRVTVEYNFSQYGIDKNVLPYCFRKINPLFAFEIDEQNDLIRWWGIATPITEAPYFSFEQCQIPTPAEASVYTSIVEAENDALLNKPRKLASRLITNTCGIDFFTCNESNSWVSILPGSNSISSSFDVAKQENITVVENNTYLPLVEDLPLYTYTITGQSANMVRIGPNPNDWNTVFNFENKDPTKKNIEVMDMMGVMLSCIKDLNSKIVSLEARCTDLETRCTNLEV